MIANAATDPAQAFLAFLAVSALVIVTPGQDTALVIRNTILGGRAGGGFTALGISVGALIWAFAFFPLLQTRSPSEPINCTAL